MTVVGGGQPSLLKCTRKCHVLYWSGAVNPTNKQKYCHYFDDGFICFLCFYFIDIFIILYVIYMSMELSCGSFSFVHLQLAGY